MHTIGELRVVLVGCCVLLFIDSAAEITKLFQGKIQGGNFFPQGLCTRVGEAVLMKALTGHREENLKGSSTYS